MHLFKTKRSFRTEFKRQLRLAITAAIGFSIAFSWRNALYDAIHEAVLRFTTNTQGIQSHIVTALVITILGVCIIFLTARLLRD